MDWDKATVAVGLLERVARGELEASTALSEWPLDAESDELLSASWHDLSHFAADLDIRMKDPRYRIYQASLLLKRVEQIKKKYGVL
jgi:hypothetical protein